VTPGRRRLLSAALTGCGATLLLVVLTGALLPNALEAAGVAGATVDTAVVLASGAALFAGGSLGAARMARRRGVDFAEVFLSGLGGVLLAWLVASVTGALTSAITGELDATRLFDRFAALLLWAALGALGAGLRAWLHVRNPARP
jgi:hypothetical protein